MRRTILAAALSALSALSAHAGTTQTVSTLFLSFAKAAAAELRSVASTGAVEGKTQDAADALSSLTPSSTENQATDVLNKVIADLDDAASVLVNQPGDDTVAHVALVIAAMPAAAPLVGAPMDWFPRHQNPASAALAKFAPSPPDTYECGRHKPCKRPPYPVTSTESLSVLLSRHQ